MKQLLLSLFLFISLLSASQTFQWAKQMGGAGGDGGQSLAVDASGNVYTTGSFQGTADFDPGAGTFNLISAGSWDVFVSKLDASGNFVWAKAMGGTGDDRGATLALDGSNNVLTTGYFFSTADFDPGGGTFNLTSAGNRDIFISKLDASGNFVWAKALGGTAADEGFSIATDASGGVYTTGYFSGTIDFDPGAGTFNLTSAGVFDIFISKLSASGNFSWARAMGGTNVETGYAIALDGFGNVYTTGSFFSTADFDPGTGVFNLTSTGNYDIFISKLDASGNFVWAKAMGGTVADEGSCITADAGGNIYVTGFFQLTADFDPGAGTYNLTSFGSEDIFVSKLDALGNFVWTKQLGSSTAERGNSIITDGLGNVYTTGYFSGTVDFDPGPGTFYIPASNYDIFFSKLNALGKFIWAGSILGGANYDAGMAIAIDASDNIYSTGLFSGTTDFDPGAGGFVLTTSGNYDIFVHKMAQVPVGFESLQNTNDIMIYPNPSSGMFYVEGLKNKESEMEVYNVLGDKVYQSSIVNQQSSIDLRSKAKGIYFVRIIAEGKNYSQKIIIQ